MKKIFLLTFLLSLTCLNLSAQDAENVDKTNSFKKNAVKVGLGGFLYGNAFLKYERHIVKKQSIEANFGIGFLNNLNRAEKAIVENDDDIDEVNIKSNRMFVNVQYRFYTGNDQGIRGFYVAPYFSWNKFGLDMDLTNVDKVKYTSDDFEYRSLNGGLQLGYQWLVADDKLVIDWYFFGVGAGQGKISGSYTSSDPNEDFQQTANDIITELEDIPYFNDRYDVTYDNNSLSAELKFPVPAFRTGISLGFAF